MDPWLASGYILFGAGVGAVASRLLHAKVVRKLKDLLAESRNHSQTEKQSHKPDERRSA